jgi:mRNA-degrading endonuclease RelE of RelBE toxin-antitoxin system
VLPKLTITGGLLALSLADHGVNRRDPESHPFAFPLRRRSGSRQMRARSGGYRLACTVIKGDRFLG